MKILKWALAALGLALAAPAAAEPLPLEMFTAQPVFRSAELSPNGRYIAGIRHENGRDILVVIDWESKTTSVVTNARYDQSLQLVDLDWKGNDRIIFIVQQRVRVVPGGVSINRRETLDDAFNFVQRVYAANRDGSNLISLWEPAQADLPRFVSPTIGDTLATDPDHILLNVPDTGGGRLLRTNIRTGESTTIDRAGEVFASWIVDANGVPVLRQETIGGGRGFAWARRGPGERRWTEIVRYRGAQAANSAPDFVGLGPALGSGRVFVSARAPGQDTAGIYIYDTATGNFDEEILRVDNFDVTNAIRDLRANTVLAACYLGYRYTCETRDQTFGAHYRALQRAFSDQYNVRIGNRSGEAGRWLVAVDGPQDFGSYYIYNLASHQLEYVSGEQPNVQPEQMPTMEVVHYTARDGTPLWGYLTIPPGATDIRNMPMVVVIHGGPEARDGWGGDPFAGWYANNGYLVFQPEYRGSGGFGRRWVEAGHRQWGQNMQTDVRDGVDYLVAQGRADRNRICVAGWSYGGYATMTASFTDADIFKCAYAGAGVSDMLGMLTWERNGGTEGDVNQSEGIGAQGIGYQYWSNAMGSASADRDMLIRYSAARQAARVGMPLLLIHGDEDDIVPPEQSIDMQRAMERAGKPTRLIMLPDEGHQWAPMTVENRRTVLQSGIEFFREHIGPGWTPPAQH